MTRPETGHRAGLHWQAFKRRADADAMALGWTRRDLAEQAGIGVSTLSALMAGKYDQINGSARKVAKALGWPDGTLDALLRDGQTDAVHPVIVDHRPFDRLRARIADSSLPDPARRRLAAEIDMLYLELKETFNKVEKLAARVEYEIALNDDPAAGQRRETG